MRLLKKCLAEGIGTAVLVVFACGVAVWTKGNVIATALAFSLAVIAMAYSIGNISGCHVNPVVSLVLFLDKKITGKELIFYIISQILGAIIGSLVLALFFKNASNLGSNIIQNYLIKYKGNDGSMLCPYLLGVLVEIILTFVFMLAVLGVLSKPENKRITGIIIGLSLGLVHLLGLALTGTSVNPARSIGPAIIEAFSGKTQALKELWIFIIGPCFGGCLALITHKCLTKSNK